MQLELFSCGKSLLHHLDPRVKILIYLPFTLLAALTNYTPQTLATLTVGVTLLSLGQLWSRLLLQRLATVNTFMLFVWATLPLSLAGTTLFEAGPFSISREGVDLAMLITLKANAIAILTITLLGTTPVIALSHAMLHLGVPSKLVTIFYFLYRYTGVILSEFERMKRMLQSRGFSPSTGMHTLKTYAYFTGMLFIKSYERAERVYHALLLRGFTGTFPLLTHFTLTPKDIMFAAAAATSIIICIKL